MGEPRHVRKSAVRCSRCGVVGDATSRAWLVPYYDEADNPRLGPCYEPFFFECSSCGWYGTESELEFQDSP
jgi:hypothetical protein